MDSVIASQFSVECIQMLQSQAAMQNAWRGINGSGFLFPSSVIEMASQCEKAVCLSVGICCAKSESHVLQHGAFKLSDKGEPNKLVSIT